MAFGKGCLFYTHCILIFFNTAQYYVTLSGVNYGKQFSKPDVFQGRFEQESPKLCLTLIMLKMLVCVCACVRMYVCVHACVCVCAGAGKVEILKDMLSASQVPWNEVLMRTGGLSAILAKSTKPQPDQEKTLAILQMPDQYFSKAMKDKEDRGTIMDSRALRRHDCPLQCGLTRTEKVFVENWRDLRMSAVQLQPCWWLSPSGEPGEGVWRLSVVSLQHFSSFYFKRKDSTSLWLGSTYCCFVLPRMISRFSKASRSVLFSGQAWISKNPIKQKESSETYHLEISILYELFEEGNDNPFQYACLENPMDRGPRQATVHGVTESDTTQQPTHLMVRTCNFFYSF